MTSETIVGGIAAGLLVIASAAVVLWPKPKPAKPADLPRSDRDTLRAAMWREADRMQLSDDDRPALAAEYRRLAALMDPRVITWGHALTSLSSGIRARAPRQSAVDKLSERVGVGQ